MVRLVDLKIADVDAIIQWTDSVVQAADGYTPALHRSADIRPREHEIAAQAFAAVDQQGYTGGQLIKLVATAALEEIPQGVEEGHEVIQVVAIKGLLANRPRKEVMVVAPAAALRIDGQRRTIRLKMLPMRRLARVAPPSVL